MVGLIVASLLLSSTVILSNFCVTSINFTEHFSFLFKAIFISKLYKEEGISYAMKTLFSKRLTAKVISIYWIQWLTSLYNSMSISPIRSAVKQYKLPKITFWNIFEKAIVLNHSNSQKLVEHFVLFWSNSSVSHKANQF